MPPIFFKKSFLIGLTVAVIAINYTGLSLMIET